MAQLRDWEKIEVDYRAGAKTLRQIADEHGISHVAINKRAKRDGWVRDLSDKIKAKAREKVTRASVTSSVTKATEQAVIEAEAEIQSRIQLSHRQDIPQKRELVAKLFAEIEGLTEGKELVEQLTLALQQGDQELLAKAARKVASLPSRIKGVADLVGAYKSLIGLEREAFGIKGESTPGETIDEFLSKLNDA
jgi:DNA-binding cell septation regulator SpoVG